MSFRKNQMSYSEYPSRAARIAHQKGDAMFRNYDTSYIMPRRSKAPVIVAVVLIVLVLAACIAGIMLFNSHVELLGEGETATVIVEEGESAQSIGESLVKARMASSVEDFLKVVREQNAEAALIPGEYRLEGGMSMDEIVDLLRMGPPATGDVVTVPEGLTRSAIASAVEQATGGRISADDFLNASSDASVWAAQFPFLETAGTNSLEGFLFPKTYTVGESDDAARVVEMMLSQFQTETQNLNYAVPEAAGLNLYQTVILASIVEKEADANTLADVASVFYNRLASDRPYLESDATTAYEVGHDPTPEDVHADSPYSTYTNPGLPPTPICSPSIESLQAVCNPSQTNYMFFYFKPDDNGDMQYYFAETYDQHQSNIAGA